MCSPVQQLLLKLTKMVLFSWGRGITAVLTAPEAGYNRYTLPGEDQAENSSVFGKSEKDVTEGNFRN